MQPRNESDSPELFAGAARQDEEALFARGGDDVLIRRERATAEQFDELVQFTIDGITREVPRATPVRDFLGNIRLDKAGNPIPRSTTIYDAASLVWPREELSQRIPLLCHQEHVTPVA